MEVDEGVVEKSASLDPPFVFSFGTVERKGVECLRRAVEQLDGEIISGTEPEPVFDADGEGEDTFLDVVGGGPRDQGAESDGFTFMDTLMGVNLLSETLLEGVVSSSELRLC